MSSGATGARGRIRDPHDVRSLEPQARVRRLANGLRLCLVDDHRSPVVATAVVYRAGGRDETPATAGVAHFLEHMMFKGSPGYGPGEVDRLTRALGGSNNAFTSHDATLYYFTFAADRWRTALEIEADRMAALTLDPVEVASERRVIEEEIAMYEGEPWDALEQSVATALFGAHPYGRPVLGSRETLRGIDGDVLRAFHRRFYRPANAVLVVAGALEPGVEEAVEEIFGALEGGEPPPPPSHAPDPRRRLHRLERRQGEVPRLLLALPAPAAIDPDHPLLLLLTAILATGRSSRLHQALVDDGQRCVWVSCDLHETADAGALAVAAEVVPGVEPAAVEEELLAEVERLRRDGADPGEVERAKKILLADWIFGHERVHQQAFLLGSALALFDLDHPWRYLERLFAAEPEELRPVADRYLRPADGGVVGWSLPKG